MPFFESLLVLLLAAIVLLQIAHRFSLAYPAMLAAAGVAVAMVPGVPSFPIDPKIALALFIAPAPALPQRSVGPLDPGCGPGHGPPTGRDPVRVGGFS